MGYRTFNHGSTLAFKGMDGVRRGLTLAEPVEEDIFHLSVEEREGRGIKTLPDSLSDAVRRLEESTLAREALGDHIFTSFVRNKKQEWDDYRIAVTDYEIDKYLPML